MNTENHTNGSTELRKVLFIDPQFQKSFLLYTVGSAIGVSTFYFAAVAIFFSRFRSQGEALGLAPDHVFFKFITEQEFFMTITFIVVTILITVGLIYYGLYLSNRIAGPIHHAKTFLQQTRTGKAGPLLQFREDDYFNSLAEEINQTLQARPARVEKIGGTQI
jgi:predicted membrane protein